MRVFLGNCRILILIFLSNCFYKVKMMHFRSIIPICTIDSIIVRIVHGFPWKLTVFAFKSDADIAAVTSQVFYCDCGKLLTDLGLLDNNTRLDSVNRLVPTR